jgi:hypothetical protein
MSDQLSAEQKRIAELFGMASVLEDILFTVLVTGTEDGILARDSVRAALESMRSRFEREPAGDWEWHHNQGAIATLLRISTHFGLGGRDASPRDRSQPKTAGDSLQPSKLAILAASEEGFLARKNGEPLTANPYLPNAEVMPYDQMIKSLKWIEGWTNAGRDSKERDDEM